MKTFTSTNLPYILAIYDVAEQTGIGADWERVPETASQYRVFVYTDDADVMEAIKKEATGRVKREKRK